MIKSEKKLLSIRKNDPQNVIVIVGIWICVATVALIFILNFSARKKTSPEPRVEVKPTEKIVPSVNAGYLRYSKAGYAMTYANQIRKQREPKN